MQKEPSAGTRRRQSRKKVEPSEVPMTVCPETAGAMLGVTHDNIARLAYCYWEAGGRQGGSTEEDWLRAEQELKSRQEAPPQQRVLRKKAAAGSAE